MVIWNWQVQKLLDPFETKTVVLYRKAVFSVKDYSSWFVALLW